MKAKVIVYLTKNSIPEDYMVVSSVAVCQELIVWFLFVFLWWWCWCLVCFFSCDVL